MRTRLRAVWAVLRGLPVAGRAALAVVVLASLSVGTASAASGVLRGSGTGVADGIRAAAGALSPTEGSGGGATETSGSTSTRHAARNRVTVRPLESLHQADFLVTLPHTVTREQLRTIAGQRGVDAVELVDIGRANVDGHPASVLGVDASTFRAFTPKLSAESDPLWLSVARGELVASFGFGHDAALPLGTAVHVRGKRPMDLRIGAFASTLPGVDAVVGRNEARGLGLPASNGVVVSAPKTDPLALRDRLAELLPKGASVQMLRKVVMIRDAGSYLTRQQINTILKAAYSRIGKPYVWGAVGPDSFDCSGLIGWAYAHAGVALPRTSQQQWFAGPHVPLSDARPGDLLFWTYDESDPSNVDHVAMYIGDGKMVVAPHTGDWVRIKPVPLSHLAGVVRVDPSMALRVGGPRFHIGGGTISVG